MMELLSPAGSRAALEAAVQSGADAVYMGFGAFNARRNAKNFTDEEFADAVAYCHLRGVRVFLTLNTLLTDRELPQAAEVLRKASQMGVDAVLVQDWGVLTLAQAVTPDLPIHASTQMSLFTSGGARWAERLGMERVVLARELSREDIANVCRNCGAEIEVFVHGALCMCYSGQCTMSALIGQRSGNRGACAQPCRLPYGVNGPCRNQFPLSLKDANLSAYLQELEAMGVACLKLEGRMKRPEYVADHGHLPAADGRKAGPHGGGSPCAGTGLLPQRLHRRVLPPSEGSGHVRHPSGERAGAQGAVQRGPEIIRKRGAQTDPRHHAGGHSGGQPRRADGQRRRAYRHRDRPRSRSGPEPGADGGGRGGAAAKDRRHRVPVRDGGGGRGRRPDADRGGHQRPAA